MTTALLAMSHSPLLHEIKPAPEVSAEIEDAFTAAREFVEQFDPDLIVNLAPDHYNGFFYELMPPFCVALAASGIGDFGSQAGDLNVPEDTARSLAEWILAGGVDTSISLRMEVDHGAVQPMEIVYGDITTKPVVPIFVNAAAPPLTPMARVRRLGELLGTWAAQRDERILFIASGGLSHDPPVPRLDSATDDQRRTLIGAGRNLSPAARAARQQRTIETAKAFARGEADIMDLAPEWDRALMEILASGDLTPIDHWTPAWMQEVAGHSAHEVRTWVAGYAALSAIGEYDVTFSYYRPIPEFIAGFGVTTVLQA
ncbi:3-carboxyethylcatechol 2,3-dioxygenase [Nocardia carnea]|uniref:3-carboxyethylcatechol 2,3-dioxygenase n=1 Tax=Nocardia carnea TaxID=37328 RepID=UPI002457FDCC|nr:3-carboxyethylcatechol 2,3-dioxygenase [Nocardia carnea]